MGASLGKKKNAITETYVKEESNCLISHPARISFKNVIYKGYYSVNNLNKHLIV